MVYYGRLANGRAVAVKRATTGRKETEEQFKNEVSASVLPVCLGSFQQEAAANKEAHAHAV